MKSLVDQAKTQIQNHDSEKLQKRTRHSELTQRSENELTPESISFERLLGSSSTNPSLNRHVSLLADSRFSQHANNVPKIRIVNQLQRNYGNTYVQHVLELVRSRKEELQTKSNIIETPRLRRSLESRINSLKSGGQLLTRSERNFFEPRFGYNFSQVRVHSDSAAADIAKSINARAFTLGNHVAVSSGEYHPDSKSGQRLLGHELAHVVQQNSNKIIQRKILIGGKYYIPKRDYKWIRKHYGESMVEFLERMHNKGNPPEYEFENYGQMHREIRMRYFATKEMKEVNTNGSVNYGRPHRLNTDYWDKRGPTHFTVKSPLPDDKKPSDAIRSIFQPGADNRLECNSLMVAVQYKAMLEVLGDDKFNAKFPNGQGILISPHHRPQPVATRHPIWEKNLFKPVTISGEGDLLPGDWVYFKNYGDYATWNSGGVWGGEHALYMGGGKYQGFGPATFAGGKSMTKVALEQELCDKYNLGADAAHQKTYTPSTSVYPSSSFIVGLRNYARRPVMKEIEKP